MTPAAPSPASIGRFYPPGNLYNSLSSHPLALSPSRPLALSPSRPLALSPSRPLAPLPLALSPSHPLPLSPSLPLPLPLPLTLSPSLPPPLSSHPLAFSPSLPLTLSPCPCSENLSGWIRLMRRCLMMDLLLEEHKSIIQRRKSKYQQDRQQSKYPPSLALPVAAEAPRQLRRNKRKNAFFMIKGLLIGSNKGTKKRGGEPGLTPNYRPCAPFASLRLNYPLKKRGGK
ncbi:MAG: hypothetical protein IPH45_16980 [Bacteroidales bacterium]|nr:hypothetical protein [Bacteroidales bacterium]